MHLVTEETGEYIVRRDGGDGPHHVRLGVMHFLISEVPATHAILILICSYRNMQRGGTGGHASSGWHQCIVAILLMSQCDLDLFS